MGIGDIWLQFKNENKEQLSDFRGDIRKETVAPQFRKIFDFFDINQNGALEAGEAELYNSIVSNLAGDNVLDAKESKSIFSQLGIENSNNIDFLDFAKNINEANKRILSSTETFLPDGSRQTVTNYKGGLRLTAVYFPDGELKYTIKESVGTEEVISSDSNNPTHSVESTYTQKGVFQQNNNNIVQQKLVEFTERGALELKFNTGLHYQDNAEYLYNMINQFDQNKEFWDEAGIDISEAWKNRNPLDAYTAEGRKKYDTYKQKAEENYNRSKDFATSVQDTPATLDVRIKSKCNVKQDDLVKMEEFHQTATKYTNAKSLKQRTEMLTEGIKKVKQLYKNAQLAKDGIPGTEKLDTDYDGKFMEILTAYFNGDSGVAAAFFESMKADLKTGTKEENEANNVLFTILDRIQEATAKTYNDTLQDETFENLESRYKREYKDMYGEDYINDEIENFISTGQQAGGLLKIGTLTAATLMINALTAGTGNIALMGLVNKPITQLLTTVGTDYALSIAGALTSKTGLTAEKAKLYAKNSLSTGTMVSIGIISSPLCKLVGSKLAQYTGKIFDSGNKVVQGAITTTTVSGENAIKSFCTNLANFTGNVGTEIGVFTGFEIITQDEEFIKACGNQGQTISQLKIINKFLQVLLGRFIKAQTDLGQKKLLDKMLKDAGLTDAKIIKQDTPQGSKFSCEIARIRITGNSEQEVIGKMITVAALKFEGVNEGVNEVVNEGVSQEVNQGVETASPSAPHVKKGVNEETESSRPSTPNAETRNKTTSTNKISPEIMTKAENIIKQWAIRIYGGELNTKEYNNIIKAITTNGDNNIVEKRLQTLQNLENLALIDAIVYKDKNNGHIILDNVELFNKIAQHSTRSLLGPDYYRLISCIDSKEILDNLVNTMNEPQVFKQKALGIIYDSKPHTIAFGKEKVKVKTYLLIHLLTGIQTDSSTNFNMEVLNIVEKNHKTTDLPYNKIAEGILTQKPELADITSEYRQYIARFQGQNPDFIIEKSRAFFKKLVEEGRLQEEIEINTIIPDDNAFVDVRNTLSYFQTKNKASSTHNVINTAQSTNQNKKLTYFEILNKYKSNNQTTNLLVKQLLDKLYYTDYNKMLRILDSCTHDGEINSRELKIMLELSEKDTTEDELTIETNSYDRNNIDYMRNRLLNEARLSDEDLQLNDIDATAEEQLSPDSKWRELGQKVLNKKTGQMVYIFENLRETPDRNGLRAKNPLNGGNSKMKYIKSHLEKLKAKGITTIIDFRAPDVCSPKAIELAKSMGFNYVRFTIDDTWTPKELTEMTNYINAVNEGNFIAGCANGQARTDLAMAINYVFNPNAKTPPKFYYGNINRSSRVSVRDSITKILKAIEANPQFIKQLGWSDIETFKNVAYERFNSICS